MLRLEIILQPETCLAQLMRLWTFSTWQLKTLCLPTVVTSNLVTLFSNLHYFPLITICPCKSFVIDHSINPVYSNSFGTLYCPVWDYCLMSFLNMQVQSWRTQIISSTTTFIQRSSNISTRLWSWFTLIWYNITLFNNFLLLLLIFQIIQIVNFPISEIINIFPPNCQIIIRIIYRRLFIHPSNR